jgi:hypothetical protein
VLMYWCVDGLMGWCWSVDIDDHQHTKTAHKKQHINTPSRQHHNSTPYQQQLQNNYRLILNWNNFFPALISGSLEVLHNQKVKSLQALVKVAGKFYSYVAGKDFDGETLFRSVGEITLWERHDLNAAWTNLL